MALRDLPRSGDGLVNADGSRLEVEVVDAADQSGRQIPETKTSRRGQSRSYACDLLAFRRVWAGGGEKR